MKLLNKRLMLGIVLLALLCLTGCKKDSGQVTDYSKIENWALYLEGEGEADVFFVCPTVDMGASGNKNMSLKDEKTKANFLGASMMELGIYNENAVMYVPYYQQVTFPVYSLSEEEAKPYFDIAYADVKAAFEKYLDKCDKNRPLIIAGFSQGGDMVLRLLKDYGNDASVSKRLVATYAIGWRLSKSEVEEYSWLVPASGEDDTGCIVIINSEAPGITESLLVPKGEWTYSINPLNWKTDETPAAKEENKGACFTDYSGAIVKEVPALTGAVINPQRGTIICPDIDPTQYSNSLFPDGVYHLDDYQFFYRNLQENVNVRLNAWKSKNNY